MQLAMLCFKFEKEWKGRKYGRDRGGILIETDVLGEPHWGIWGLTQACPEIVTDTVYKRKL